MPNPEIIAPKARALTARELIKVLGNFDPNLPVHYLGEEEYEVEVVEEEEALGDYPRRILLS